MTQKNLESRYFQAELGVGTFWAHVTRFGRLAASPAGLTHGAAGLYRVGEHPTLGLNVDTFYSSIGNWMLAPNTCILIFFIALPVCSVRQCIWSVKLVSLQKQSEYYWLSEAAPGRIPVWRGRGAGCLGKLPVFGRGGDGFCAIISDEPTRGMKVFYQTSHALTHLCTISGLICHYSTRQSNNSFFMCYQLPLPTGVVSINI